MKNTWRQLFRRLAAGCVITASVAWSSAMCYAVQFAYDDASNPAYQVDDANSTNDGNPANNTNGWQAGDNGGSGFTPWNFDTGYFYQGVLYPYANPGFHEIDDGAQGTTQFSNPHNDIGKSWTVGYDTSDGTARYGRGFSPLQIGQTFSVVFDTPTVEDHYNGYFLELHGGTGGVKGNICNGGHSCSVGGSGVEKLTLWRFEYFNYGQWKISDGTNGNGFAIDLYDTDTTTGARMDVTRTGANTYDMSVTIALGTEDEEVAFTRTGGTFLNSSAPLDWFTITFFNTASDQTPTEGELQTDLYIHSMAITGPTVAGDFNGNGSVDAADYVLWRNNGPLAVGSEVSDPGTVSAQDYIDWRARFGNPTPGGGGGAFSSAVPEPGSGVLLAMAATAALGLGTARRRRAE